MNRWWVIHDDALRDALIRVDRGDTTWQEAYAVLCEHSEAEPAKESDKPAV